MNITMYSDEDQDNTWHSSHCRCTSRSSHYCDGVKVPHRKSVLCPLQSFDFSSDGHPNAAHTQHRSDGGSLLAASQRCGSQQCLCQGRVQGQLRHQQTCWACQPVRVRKGMSCHIVPQSLPTASERSWLGQTRVGTSWLALTRTGCSHRHMCRSRTVLGWVKWGLDQS